MELIINKDVEYVIYVFAVFNTLCKQP